MARFKRFNPPSTCPSRSRTTDGEQVLFFFSFSSAVTLSLSMTDQEQILEELRPALRMLFFNEFASIKKLFKQRPDSFYHLMGLAMLRTGLAGITLDKTKFKLAMDTAWMAIKMSDEHRKKDGGILFRADANDFSDDECHAELAHSELLAIYGGLCAVEDQSLMGFVKGALRVRSCYSGLKECERIMKAKTNWQSEVLRQEFCSGVLLDLGLFEMSVSFVPRKFMILLELAGFSSNRSFGLDKMESAASYELSLRRLGAMVSLFGYHMFAEYFYGLGEVRRDLVLDYVKFASTLFPSSPYANLIEGLIDNVLGNFQSALRNFDSILQQPTTPRGMTYALLYQKSWLNAYVDFCVFGCCVWQESDSVVTDDLPCPFARMQCNWREAMENSRILKEECKWSRSLFAFMYAIFASQVLKEGKDPVLEDAMVEALVAVPKLKRHFGGKRAFHEKIVIEKAAVYVQQPEKMVLPQLDLMYLWNLFIQASHHAPSLKKIKRLIEQELDMVKADHDPDLFAYLTFMRGCAYAASRYESIAADCFLRVIASHDSIRQNKHLLPQACFEMGMVYRRAGDVEESKKWFRKTKRYSGYLTETMISFRVDCALKTYDDLAQKAQQELASSSSSSSSATSPDEKVKQDCEGDCDMHQKS